MKRHYFISDDLDDLQRLEQELREMGITNPQIHVLSEDEAGLAQRGLHSVEAVLQKDVVRGTERGALIGLIAAAGVLLLAWLTGVAESVTWVPAVFLAIVVLGFCTWEGGLIGIGEEHAEFKRFRHDLRAGRHLFFVDLEREQEADLRWVVSGHPGLEKAGEGAATPGLVVRFQDRWARFLQLAP